MWGKGLGLGYGVGGVKLSYDVERGQFNYGEGGGQLSCGIEEGQAKQWGDLAMV